ncbi:MAG: hypothetical protein HND47_21500 [Chloroflexi bacterium]|nr:hypothetical protein [Chloroflexota bacterium]
MKYYLSKVKFDDTVDIEAIVSDTAWATPARIMSAVTKDAVRLALFDGRDKISQRDIELAFQEQAIGLENPIEEMEEDQRKQVAYHEAGHAVAQHYLRPDERIVRVSIIRRADALGYVLPVSNFDVYAMPLRRFVADIMVSMAGHVATKIFLGEYWTGATGDFQNIRARLWQPGSLRVFRSADCVERRHGCGRQFQRQRGFGRKILAAIGRPDRTSVAPAFPRGGSSRQSPAGTQRPDRTRVCRNHPQCGGRKQWRSARFGKITQRNCRGSDPGKG